MPIEQKFAEYCANYIVKNFNSNDTYIVTPTSIAKSKIINNLITITKDKNNIYESSTLDELCFKLINYDKADDLELTLQLCEILLNNNIKKPFNQLYFLAHQILEEFNEIDLQLVNIPEYFKYLTNYHNQFSQNINFPYISINVLQSIYINFTEYLKNKKTCYSGLAFRVCSTDKAEELKNFKKKIIIVGFYQFTESEKNFLTILKNSNKAYFFWDYDNLYLNDPHHQAGYYIRSLIKKFPPPIDFAVNFNSNKLLNTNKQINIIKSDSIILEIKKVIDIITQHTITNNSKLAIISFNSKYTYLYTDAINNLPFIHKTIAEKTIINTKLDSFLDLISNFNTNININDAIKDLSKHDFIKLIYSKDYENIINDNNLTELLTNHPLFSTIINNKNNNTPKGALQYLIDIFTTILNYINTKKEPEEDKYIIKESLIYLKQIYNNISTKINIADKDAFKLIIKLLKSHKIPQKLNLSTNKYILITDLYQTSVLDFDNVICVDMNENNNIFTTTNNLISTYKTKKLFNLRTFEDKNRTETYLFYRLLQNAKNIYLIYKQYDIDGRQIEENRFIKQIKYGNIINNITSDEPKIYTPKNNKNIIINKDFIENINIKKLNLSASAIVTLLECPLKFYFKYILNISIPKQNFRHLIFGSAFHKVMQQIYQNYRNKIITDSIIRELKATEIQPIISNLSIYNYNLTQIEERILLEYTNKILDYDLTKVPFKLKNTELSLSHNIKLKINDISCDICINGIIDRIDEHEDSIEIIDYKTGEAKNLIFEDTGFNNVKTILGIKDNINNHQIQLLIYYLIYSKNTDYYKKNINISLLNTKKLFNPNLSTTSEKYHINEDISKDIENFIKRNLTKLFETNNHYIKTSINKKDVCDYCPYKEICNI